MTKREGAIISAFTGFLVAPFSSLQEYVEEVLDRPVLTHEMGDPDTVAQIKEKVAPDFNKLMESLED